MGDSLDCREICCIPHFHNHSHSSLVTTGLKTPKSWWRKCRWLCLYIMYSLFSLSFFSYTAFTMAFWPKSTGLHKKWSGLHLEWCSWSVTCRLKMIRSYFKRLKAPLTATTFSNFLLVENWTIDCSVIMKTCVFLKTQTSMKHLI